MYEQIFMRKYFRTPHFYKTNLRPQTFPYLKSENLTKHTYKKKKKSKPAVWPKEKKQNTRPTNNQSNASHQFAGEKPVGGWVAMLTLKTPSD